MFSKIVLLSWATACVFAAPPVDVVPLEKQQPTVIPIVSQSDELEADGTYKFSYETGNGIKREEIAYEKVLPKGEGRSADSNEGGESDESNEIHVQRGSYSYTAPDGTVITVSYIADENGFQPVGDHIPRVPGIASSSSAEKSGRTLKHTDSAESASSFKQLKIAAKSAVESSSIENKPAELVSVASLPESDAAKSAPIPSQTPLGSTNKVAQSTESTQPSEAAEPTEAAQSTEAAQPSVAAQSTEAVQTTEPAETKTSEDAKLEDALANTDESSATPVNAQTEVPAEDVKTIPSSEVSSEPSLTTAPEAALQENDVSTASDIEKETESSVSTAVPDITSTSIPTESVTLQSEELASSTVVPSTEQQLSTEAKEQTTSELVQSTTNQEPQSTSSTDEVSSTTESAS